MNDLEQMKTYYKTAIRLFPDVAPGSEGVELEEELFAESWQQGMTKVIAQNVLVPVLLPFIPEKCNGTAVIVVPGGGFRREVMNLEGTKIANWLNDNGIAAFVLKHRMPINPHKPMWDVPLMDAQRAMRIVRSKAAEWGIEKVGIMGFSAGGHLSSLLATCFDKEVYAPIDEIDQLSSRPDFTMLGYPVISIDVAQDMLAHVSPERLKGEPQYCYLEHNSTDKFVRPDMPPVFIMETDDDTTTSAEHSLAFYMAARKAKVPAELHIFKSGNHGYGLGDARAQVYIWPELFLNWLKEIL